MDSARTWYEFRVVNNVFLNVLIMARLTTHVFDIVPGFSASGVAGALFRLQPDRKLLADAKTSNTGRLDTPILDADSFATGIFELISQADDFYRANQRNLPEHTFVDEVVARFGIANTNQHYHVPLLVSPWSHSTYRSS